MSERDQIEQAIRRPQQYWYEDGLAEIAAGGMFLLAGGLLYAAYRGFQANYANLWTSPWTLVIGAALIVLVAVLGRRIAFSVDFFKRRVTYPRTGFVAPQRKTPRQYTWPQKIGRYLLMMAASLLLGGVLGWLLAFLLETTPLQEWMVSMPVSLGVMLGLVLVILARRLAIRRFYVVGALAALGGVLIATQDSTFSGSILTVAALGGLLLASGLVTLARYLRHTAPASEGNHVG